MVVDMLVSFVWLFVVAVGVMMLLLGNEEKK